ncbi:hypothetical protein A2957_03415 [Candidatus Roizmanbacteria bacterium RIFCSPLOWO2_01_FULL_38_11]|uniref:R3H domain-containing protein n=1 Tax=Candidatus Roizmanbacteria bacterium RIFCSPLOWO2_01_FULL_38_11 TaxID=1802060 RepID=A0A1F7IP82_9BACT|nr:MAG: hypothetical protein A2957_03415 [Candidatus Roizmanbacteria bacterium RIFCSPLOWO2_01_FULL_38_11]
MEEKESIKKLTEDLLEKIGFTVKVEISESDGITIITLSTEDEPSLLIGKHAHMLAALQRVISAMLYKQFGKKVDVLLDVNDYRVGQKERLIKIADSISQRVITEQRPSTLRSFSSYERRIIHEHIANNYMSLQSHSEGEGQDRVMIIEQK